MNKKILQTARLKISIPTIDSLDNWCDLQSDKDVMKYIGDGKVRNTSTTKENLEFTINHYKEHGFSQFDIFLKSDGKFIGKAGLNYLPKDKNNDIEIGYLLHKKYWGKGYATELAEAFIKWGFDNFHFSRIVACCEVENAASSNVMKKCKMKYKGKYLYNGKNECDIYQINNIVIKTENFYLRPFHEKDDYRLCYDLWHDKDVIKPMGINPDDPKEDIKKKLLRYKSFMDKYGFTNFAVFKKDNDEFIGSCGFSIFHDPDGDHNPLPKNKNGYEVELGYLFYKKYWGKGYAGELTKFCIDFIFNNYSKINRIVAVTHPANIASGKVLEKIGFEFVSDVNSKEYGTENFYVVNRPSSHMGLPAEYQQIPEYFDKHNISDDTDIKNKAIEKLLKEQDVKNILDMTCGTGSQVFYLNQHGYKVTGSDFSPELLNIARKKAKEQNLDIEFIDGDMRFARIGSFDSVITMFNAIGHLSREDFAKALKNISENLVENGIYIFDIFNLNTLTEKAVEDLKMDQKFEVNGDKIHQIQHSKLDRKNAILTSYDNYKIKDKSGKTKEINNSFSLQIYTSKELKEILEENGFKILKFSDIYGKEFIEDKSLNILVLAEKI